MNKRLMHALSALNAWVYRASGGRLLGRFSSGAPVCLLTTMGRRSGQTRTVPLLYLPDGADFIVVASQGGAPQHPGWYLNLQANPRAELQAGRQRFPVIGHVLDAAERARFWPKLVAIYPAYQTYQQRTTREIPLLRLSPAAPDAGG
ncbi:MAG TPA: nitroreductase family deazaflavin-dependent oxidoreductase [Acetobacteraceae bacterium]|nr:nitroreductase family deazaflavin-dependent oxidoreductase [Acetobacteraceae bacterium]